MGIVGAALAFGFYSKTKLKSTRWGQSGAVHFFAPIKSPWSLARAPGLFPSTEVPLPEFTTPFVRKILLTAQNAKISKVSCRIVLL